ncbi:DNA-binding MarR family transcriptional regulator [Pseudochelatococcus lubricantis]|uniref:DNA-binding MarR family transcriptional regulator n=1 Tax=Pseudochelatococcus lubricantis TaxID=1538102 RepID=A0ABX0V6Z7_9HYPH|nr:MarR family transcriptional regulator [Pseudochelatococcus lubricantis]NIJ58881.1 DNA-binding MarR family transcriptional regulator [Pseudochelatococcus lubricantis]
MSNALPLPDEIRKDFRKTDWPFYWIVRVSAVYTQVMEGVLKPIDLDMPAWRVLMSLHEGQSLSISEIADFCVIRLNTTTKIIQRMTTEGLVERHQSRSDGRVTEVRITEKGEQARRLAWAEAERIFSAGFEAIDPAEIEAMNATLHRAFANLRRLRETVDD